MWLLPPDWTLSDTALFWNAGPALAAPSAQRVPAHGRSFNCHVPDTEPVARTQQKTQNTCLRCKSQSLQSGRDELNRQPGKYKTAAAAVLRQVHGAECGLLRGVRAGFPEEGTNERGSTSTQAINLGEREELSRHGEEQRPLGRRTRGTEPRLERRGSGTLPRITVKPGWGGDFSPHLRIAGLFS